MHIQSQLHYPCTNSTLPNGWAVELPLHKSNKLDYILASVYKWKQGNLLMHIRHCITKKEEKKYLIYNSTDQMRLFISYYFTQNYFNRTPHKTYIMSLIN